MTVVSDLRSLKVIMTSSGTVFQKAEPGEGGYWMNGKKVPDEIVREAMRRNSV